MPTSISIVRTVCPEMGVRRVVDAKKNVTIEITKKDAGIGRRKGHRVCVMAQACKRKLKLDDVIVAMRRAYLIKNGVAVRYSVPEAISRELVSFDRGGRFQPGTYELKKPSKIKARGAGTRHPGDASPGRLRHRRHATTEVRAPLNALPQ